MPDMFTLSATREHVINYAHQCLEEGVVLQYEAGAVAEYFGWRTIGELYRNIDFPEAMDYWGACVNLMLLVLAAEEELDGYPMEAV